ncbi:hypothetical protein [Vibrio phage VpKK5]|uniref:hypothetical protein n=1 Tax=Vibrio phage VpKK5 TaxID=1538804 RepID=UPI0004F6BE47|nr:hypothetical protein VC55_gp08 [Vibrio phage VpKK5]AIM40592.1 hypothetical protein [Vibrio phage VpKK5]
MTTKTQQIYDFIVANPWCRTSEIADQIGINRNQVASNVHNGLVKRRGCVIEYRTTNTGTGLEYVYKIRTTGAAHGRMVCRDKYEKCQLTNHQYEQLSARIKARARQFVLNRSFLHNEYTSLPMIHEEFDCKVDSGCFVAGLVRLGMKVHCRGPFGARQIKVIGYKHPEDGRKTKPKKPRKPRKEEQPKMVFVQQAGRQIRKPEQTVSDDVAKALSLWR